MGLLSAVAIFAAAPHLPRFDAGPESHKRLVQAVFFSGFAFAIWISQFWGWRHIGAFWTAVCVLLLAHVLCVWLYSRFVQRILVWQWGVGLIFESYVAVFFIGWFTKQFSPSAPDI